MMELALGTVQFGVAYGVADRSSPVAESEAQAILAQAWEAGIRRLDTAPAYGDIEQRLATLCGPLGFSIVSKIPPLPEGLAPGEIAEWLRQSVETSRRRLGDRLCGLIFHDASLPLGPHGELVRETLLELTEGSGIRTGSSHYDLSTLDTGHSAVDQMAQFPGNAYDQRIASLSTELAGTEVSLRSVFLQGLLLAGPETAAQRVPAALDWIQGWSRWCAAAGVSRLVGALSIAKSFSAVDYCLVGVDSAAQLLGVTEAWAAASAKEAPELAGDDPDVFDPRRWRSRRD